MGWERFAGQVVQAVLTLLVLPSPVHSYLPLVAVGIVVAAARVVVTVRVRPGGGGSIWAKIRSAVAGDIRDVVLARRAWMGIALASALVVCGHALTFLIAARTAGIAASPSRVLPLALIMVVPSVGGWGPREGGSAWAFAAVGLGAGRGVTTAVVYGVLVFVSTLPGAAVLVISWVRRIRPAERTETRIGEEAVHA